ncbi:hypothetical protein X797_003461 [Metarhizium robertsii]|uniref:Uncharacterized protein n=1 Tax=Metarhizium robertsii TaxID=568076 RepID=A0A0A1V041_9HYPO|nr:hypothetical protein X797_003461 [Metarhizium robertsii]
MYHATDLIGSDALYYSTWYSQRRRSSVLHQPPNKHGTASTKGEARQHEVRWVGGGPGSHRRYLKTFGPRDTHRLLGT